MRRARRPARVCQTLPVTAPPLRWHGGENVPLKFQEDCTGSRPEPAVPLPAGTRPCAVHGAAAVAMGMTDSVLQPEYQL